MSISEHKPGGPVAQDGADLWRKTGAKKTAEAKRTERLLDSLPPRIKIGARHDGRPKPYFVRYGSPRKTESFALEVDRNDAAERLVGVKRTDGSAIMDFDAEEWRAYLAFKKRVAAPLHEVERVWEQVRGNVSLSLDTKAAVDRYRELRQADGLAQDSYRHAKTILDRFVTHCGHLPLVAVTAEHLREWLAELKKKHAFSPVTLRHHRKEVNTFFSRALLEKWCLENPCRAVKPPKAIDTEIHFLRLKEAFGLFKANRDQRCIGKLALEAFAGLRCSAAALATPDDLDHETQGVVIGRLKTTGRRHYVDGFPENLWGWMKHAAADECWDITERNYDKLKGDAFIRASVQNPGNVLRHSFATHHVAAFRDAAKTAVLLCHSSPAMLYRHYNGRGVPQAEALGYFQITPETVLLTFEQFLASLAAKPCLVLEKKPGA